MVRCGGAIRKYGGLDGSSHSHVEAFDDSAKYIQGHWNWDTAVRAGAGCWMRCPTLPSSDLASADNVALAGVVVWARPSTLAFNRRPQLIASAQWSD
jgi:hypothetical protein